jgi:hypothetical protein
MAETYRIQVITSTYVPEFGHTYTDAQYLTVPSTMSLDEVKATYEAEIKAEEASRIAARVYEKQNPVAPKELSKEELEAVKLDVLNQATAQIAELDEKIAVAKPAKDIVKDVVAEEIIP